MERYDGSIQSHALPNYENQGRADHCLYRCMVTVVKYTDSSENYTQNSQNPQVLYDVVVLGGNASGQVISNCKLASILGNDNNYYERILKPTSKSLTQDPLSKHNGDIVYVLFNQGHSGYPVIIGLDNGINTLDISGATREDGIRLKSQFNGVEEEITKEGFWCFTRKAGKFNAETMEFELSPSEEGSEEPNYEAQLKFIENQMIWRDPNSSVIITKDTPSMVTTLGQNDEYKETIDVQSEKTLRQYKTGLRVTEDGSNDKMIIQTKDEKVKVEVDGQNNKVIITSGETVLEIDGGTGKISLKGDLVDLGSSVTDFVTKFTELATAFNTHTHIAPQAPAGSLPTLPPSTPLLISVGSQTVQVQD